MVYVSHSFLVHSSADGHLGCFHVLAMINSQHIFLNTMDLGADTLGILKVLETSPNFIKKTNRTVVDL